ncbi:hypothetical protein MKX03_030457 [Papaver bracteatum]|nr:hypothetical protein MKX03_030457 [Papaver bracteatum]
MDVLFNGAQRSDLKPGNHIYTYRACYAYSHHGIYIGGDMVVHFTQERDESSGFGASLITSALTSSSIPSNSNFSANLELPNPSGSASEFPSNLNSSDSSGLGSNSGSINSFGSGSNLASTCSNVPDCGFKNPNSGVVLSCLDCFLGSGSLYLFEYEVTPSIFFAKVRGGTCTTAKSDPTDMVIHRAMYLLEKVFGNYNIFLNNCEDFALYCKTGLIIDKSGVGRSGQAASFVGAPLAAILATPLRFLMPAPVGMTVAAGMYCLSRYATDIGVRSDVIKVDVEDMSVGLGWVRNPGKEAAEEDYKPWTPIFFKSDPTDMVIHRAVYLLRKGFGKYDILLNNCEDFALYCKTGLLTLDKLGVGRGGQAASVVGAPLAAILGNRLRFLMPAPVGMAVTAGIYCVGRYATDIGVRSDVIKVAVEDMSVDLGWVRNPGKEAAEEDDEVSKREIPNHGLGSSSNPKRKKSSKMGVLFNGAQRSDLKPGDHIYTYRACYAYSHHGIYIGGDMVVHFTQERKESSGFAAWLNTSAPSSSIPSNLNSFDSSGLGSNSGSFNSFDSGSNLASNCSNPPDCGFKNPNSGVVLSCLDCFLGSGSLYLFEYEVTPSIFFAKIRGGTCTMAKSDPTDMVIHRAMYLLEKGFGNYDIFLNNCEDFALYCKTGLLILDKSGVGRSGQASSVVGARIAAILATPLRFLVPAPVGMAVTAGMYCVSRYATDIGVRSDVIKVAVEDMSVDLGWEHNPGKEAAEEVNAKPWTRFFFKSKAKKI